MEAKLTLDSPPVVQRLGGDTVFTVLAAITFSHFLNDLMQSVFPAIYPVFKSSFSLSFTQIGLLTLAFQGTASILQPLIGLYADRRPQPYLLSAGMGFVLLGLLLVSLAPSFTVLLCAASLLGTGSSIFHPESSRVARMASGGQHGLAQSMFQAGGNLGSSTGPLLAALIIIPGGQRSVAWFALVALLGMIVLWRIGGWYARHRAASAAKPSRPKAAGGGVALSKRQVFTALAILCALIFSKYFYLSSLSNYYTFYLIDKFHLSVQQAQVHLFLFLLAVGIGTIVGGPVGDRIGRKTVIWCSILGVLPFTLLLPYVDLFWTSVLSVVIGMIIASAFAAIVVFAQELVPGKIGMISGFFFGFAFGMAAIGAAVLGKVADLTSIEFVYRLCGFLPAIGILAAFLPNLERGSRTAAPSAAPGR